MKLIQQIKEQQVQAMKEKNREESQLLLTLYAEAVAIGKNNGNRETTDEETLNVIKKFLKGSRENIEISKKYNRDYTKFEKEVALLEKFLPKQMTVEQLHETIKLLVIDEKLCRNMGHLMQHLKQHFSNQYDPKLAATIAKEYFN